MNSRVLVIALAIATCMASLDAQTPRGAVAGTVKDPSGSVLPGVIVTISGVGLSQPRSMVTRSNGAFRLTELPDGSYSLMAELAGFKRSTQTVVISGGREIELPVIVLEIGEISEPNLKQMGLAPDDLTIAFETSVGRFPLTVRREAAPAIVDVILKHIDAHHYDGGRVVPVPARDASSGAKLDAMELIARADVPDAAVALAIRSDEQLVAGPAHEVIGRVWRWSDKTNLIPTLFHNGFTQRVDIIQAYRIFLMRPDAIARNRVPVSSAFSQ